MQVPIVEGRGLLGGFDASLRAYAERKFRRDRIKARLLHLSQANEALFTILILIILLFLTILTIGFWLMMFLVNFVFYWIFGATRELLRERREKKELEQA